MSRIQSKQLCILAIAPSTRGFGYVVLEGETMFVAWGVKGVKKEGKNAQSLALVKKLIVQYHPGMLVLEDASAKGSRRAPRIRTLTRQITRIAETHNVSVKLFPRAQVMDSFFVDGKGTKYQLAETIARRFPEEVGLQLPPKRKAWQCEDPRMGIFAAVALAIAFRLKYARQHHSHAS